MKTREELREEQRQYEADFTYQVWRSGGNPDMVRPERIDDHYYAGHNAEEAAHMELRKERQRREERMDEAWEDLGNTLRDGSRDGEGV